MQSRRHSAIESGVNTFLGFFGSFAIVWLWLRYGSMGPAVDATVTTVLCTVWSLLRGYYVRRVFVALGTDRPVGAATPAPYKIDRP